MHNQLVAGRWVVKPRHWLGGSDGGDRTSEGTLRVDGSPLAGFGRRVALGDRRYAPRTKEWYARMTEEVKKSDTDSDPLGQQILVWIRCGSNVERKQRNGMNKGYSGRTMVLWKKTPSLLAIIGRW